MPARPPAARALLGGALLALVGGLAPLATAAPARAAEPVADYELPFPCGQSWTGSTRARHSPSTRAIDFNRPDDAGDPVVASAPGTVTTAQARSTSGYGRYVVLDHGGGESTLYAHLQSVTVQLGQRVDQGAQVGLLGSTGNSSGPHLHYEQRLDRAVQEAWFSGAAFRYGSTVTSRNCLDVPLAANMESDARAELVVFRRQARAQFLVQRPNGATMTITMGTATDEPVLGDWDGNGRANPGTRVPSTSRFTMRTPAGTTSVVFGLPSDRGIAGDWDGDARWDVGVHRARSGHFLLRGADGTTTTFAFGDADDLPITGDWNGDGRTDVGVFDSDSAVFSLRYVDSDGTEWTADVAYGEPGHLPVVGDWDGNGRADVGTWDPATATFSRRVAPSATSRNARTVAVRWGRPR